MELLVQAHFNATVFAAALADYEKEGIPLKGIVPPDNSQVIDLFDARPHGIFHLLQVERLPLMIDSHTPGTPDAAILPLRLVLSYICTIFRRAQAFPTASLPNLARRSAP